VWFADDATLSVSGELDVASAPDLEAVLDALIDRDHRQISVECDELRFIDASGLRVFASAQARLESTEGQIHISGLSALAYRIFEMTDLVELLDARPRAEVDSDPGSGGTEWLTSHASSLAAEAAASERSDASLCRILDLAPDLLGSCDGSSLTVLRNGHLMTVAATDETVRLLDRFQYAARTGPAIDAAERGLEVEVTEMEHERRWDDFPARARERGMQSVMSVPLTVDGRPVGALNLYSRSRNAFVPEDRRRAIAFAHLASMFLEPPVTSTARAFESRVRDALASRDVIANAQGVLMERLGLRADEAFDVLRQDAVEASDPLRECALRVLGETRRTVGASGSGGSTDG
jgi:anti-anti-sigma factor